MRPLEGLIVVDLSRVLAGPWATQILADLGAEVIKVERPGTGDDTRSWGPPFLKDQNGAETSDAAYFMSANRGKKSLAVDIAAEEGAEVVRRLAARADVLYENFKVGALAKYGLDYASLKATNERLVYCSITGFGQTGPEAGRAGYDFIIQAMAGLMSVTGSSESGPQKVGVAISDLTTGMYSVIAVLAALRAREKSGDGCHIDMALFDTQLAWLANQNMNYLIGGDTPRPIGNAHPNIVPYQDFATADGRIILAVGNDRQFARLAKLLGEPGWAADRRFATGPERIRNREILVAGIARHFARKTTSEWRRLLDAATIPCAPINSIPEAFAEPQAAARGLKFDLPHAAAGSVPQVATPIRFGDGAPAHADRAPPLLGADGDAVLAWLGYEADEIESLKAGCVVG